MGQPAWSLCGYGCIIHPRIVLTSFTAWEETQDGRTQMYDSTYGVSIKVGESQYQCELGFSDEKRDLAALVVSHPLPGREGKKLKTFPDIADGPPAPGQALGLLVEQNLVRATARGRYGAKEESFICYTYGYTSLLRGKKELLFALSGILTNDQQVGAAVFDEAGKIYGVVTSYLRHYVDSSHQHATAGAGCFVAFAPVYQCAKGLLRLPAATGAKSAPLS